MTVGVNASQARSKSQQDMTIFEETNAIMHEIISRSQEGHYDAVIDTGTIMTDSNPVSTLIGQQQNPVVSIGSTIIINESAVTLGTSGTNLNAIIADINDAQIPGVVASKTNGYLVLTITHVPAVTWQYEIGQGTANLALGIYAGIYTATNPKSVEYFNVWQGLVTDRAITQQMNLVIKHFQNLGFKIDRSTNLATGHTLQWNVYW